MWIQMKVLVKLNDFNWKKVIIGLQAHANFLFIPTMPHFSHFKNTKKASINFLPSYCFSGAFFARYGFFCQFASLKTMLKLSLKKEKHFHCWHSQHLHLNWILEHLWNIFWFSRWKFLFFWQKSGNIWKIERNLNNSG